MACWLPSNSPKLAEPVAAGVGCATGVAIGGGVFTVGFATVVAGIEVVVLGGWPTPKIKYAEAPATTISSPIPTPINHLGILL